MSERDSLLKSSPSASTSSAPAPAPRTGSPPVPVAIPAQSLQLNDESYHSQTLIEMGSRAHGINEDAAESAPRNCVPVCSPSSQA